MLQWLIADDAMTVVCCDFCVVLFVLFMVLMYTFLVGRYSFYPSVLWFSETKLNFSYGREGTVFRKLKTVPGSCTV